jgi:predicted ATPase/DNA-binding CsgD family transcriptional regulator
MTTDIAIGLGNLPAEPNSFVGRVRDLAELALMLGQVRALTLCGPGGIGKTRLALRLAGDIAPDFPDGAWLVDLADTADPGLLAQRIATTLGIREEPGRLLAATLTDALRPRRLLLILDTCEHMVDACAALAHQLLAGCPRLRLIATSREPLRVRGETAWRVPPLELPSLPGGPDGLAELARHEAVRLFADRAAAVRPTFALGPDNIHSVAQLCRTLDGMPLAIELAAARVSALSVEQIAARLDDRFQLLATGDRTAPLRQQTLRAAVDWSYELLTDAEQVLLRRLSVFSGWNLDMAEQVCADSAIPAGRVLDLLAALIDKSLVTLEPEVDGESRYRLLDTIREYAASWLAASGEASELRRRHRDYMLAMAEGVAARAFVRGDPPWPARVAMYNRITADRANFRAALTISLERGDAAQGLRLCSALRSPWIAHGDVTEGVTWFDRFLGLGGCVPASIRARALMLRAELGFEQQDYLAASDCAQAGLQACREAGDGREAGALRMLALVSLRSGRGDEALARADAAAAAARTAGDDWEEGLALATRAAVIARQGKLNEAQRGYEAALDVLRDNNGWGVAQTLSGFGGLARARGDNAAALRYFGDALALFGEIGARPEIARCLAGIGWVALSQHDLALARSSLTECLRLSLATGQRLAIARGLEAFAVLAIAQHDPERAARLQGAALALREELGGVPSSPARTRLRQLLDSARGQLDPAAAAALLDEGRAMSAFEAARLAVGPAASPAASGAGERTAGNRADGNRADGNRADGLTEDRAAGGAGDRADGLTEDRAAGGAGDRAAEDVPAAQPAYVAQPVPPGRGGAGAPSALTAREHEVAALIARGMSNRGIADTLVISPATAARHVANIFTKLGFSSRAQVAAWVVERQSVGQG